MKRSPFFFRMLILIAGIAAICADSFSLSFFFVLKPLCTLLILTYLFLYKNTNLTRFAHTLGIGLLFCLIGDSFLLFEHYFIFGLASFLLAHLIFLYAFVKRQGWQWKPRVAGVLILFASAVFALVYQGLGAMLFPVLAYLTVIVVMSWQGWALALNPKMEQAGRLGLAVSLFLVSDALIALDKFYFSFPLSGVAILATYWHAIYFIARSATK